MTTKKFRTLAAAALACCLAGCGPIPPAADPAAPTPLPSVRSSAVPRAQQTRITYPAAGHRRWAVAKGAPAAGGGLRYRVVVETDIAGLTANDFARQVTATLDDPRGWRVPMRRVGPGQPYDFTIYLATPATRDVLCGSGPDGYTSCRYGDRVVLNVARWVKSIPGYDLSTYRQYMVEHEVGHRLGHGHERCPGRGRPAPVMQQQTLGLHGCTPNPWPYLDGARYAGVSGVYGDPTPPSDLGRS
jgi:hypothetical protein